jgi:tetratricopeptide (TPR) repeat protein
MRSEAIDLFKRSLAERNDKFTLLNLGSTLLEEKRILEAMDCFEASIQDSPDFAPGHISLAYCLFLMGDWENGWAEYEYRFSHYPQAKTYRLLFPLNGQWDGNESLAGKRIILYCEQGIGDSFHFIRYAKILKERGASVIIHCHSSLNSLFTQQDYIDGTLNIEKVTDPLPSHDFHCSLLSLPHLLNHPAPPAAPYLKASAAAPMKQYESYFRIGIIWAGNAEHPNDDKRSCPLRMFQPLHDLPGVKLFSFQKDLRLRKYRNQQEAVDLAADAEKLRAVHLGYHIQDWADTASLLLEMDMIVSVDTAVLHLAGALGVPSIALLPYVPDWRWTAKGERTIWYEQMMLLRQNEEGDWEELLERAAVELQKKRPV